MIEQLSLLKAQHTHRIGRLPILILMPHSSCNCRCVMCDIWKANASKHELSVETLKAHVDAFKKLNVRWVVLSGGEALLHRNLWAFCAELKKLGIKITLLSTGLLLAKNAGPLTRWCDEIIVSLDGSRAVHDRIRNIPQAFDKLVEGVRAVRRQKSAMPISGRCVVQKQNFDDLPNIIQAAQEIPLDRISFLAADVSSTAFERPTPWSDERSAEVALNQEEVARLELLTEQIILEHADLFESDFIAESPEKLRKLAQHYSALLGKVEFQAPRCNAPWVSAVVEANGVVRPCFFHEEIGNIYKDDLPRILNSSQAVNFRKRLNVATNSICQKCTCSLYISAKRGIQVGTSQQQPPS